MYYKSLTFRVYDHNGNEKPLSLVDFGCKCLSEVTTYLTTNSTEQARMEMENLKQRCLAFLKHLVEEVQNCLPADKQVFQGLRPLTPSKILSQTERSQFAQLPFQYLRQSSTDEIEAQLRSNALSQLQ